MSDLRTNALIARGVAWCASPADSCWASTGWSFQDHLVADRIGAVGDRNDGSRVCDVLFHSVGSGNNVIRSGRRSMGILYRERRAGLQADDRAPAVLRDYVGMWGPWRDRYLDKG